MINLNSILAHGYNIGSCCGSSLIHKDKPFTMTLGIIIGEGKREYKGKPQDTFVVIDTRNGPLSIATRGSPEKGKK